MAKELKIILANAPILNGNKGCVALGLSSIYIIDKVLNKLGIRYKLFLPDSYFHDGKEHSVSINEKTFDFFDCDYPIGRSYKETIKFYFRKMGKPFLKARKIFLDADCILDIGQGDSFADIYGIKRFMSINRIHVLAQKYKKKYCILPQTIGPFKSNLLEKSAKKSIEKASLCLVRDRQSFDYTKELAPRQKNLKEIIDVAFCLPYCRQSFDSNYVHVGLNISGLLWNGGYTRNNQFEVKESYQEVIQSIIDYFLSLPNVIVHLISHVATGSSNVENDYEVCYKLWKKYGQSRLIIAPFFFGPIEAKDYIAGLDFFLGARMHSTIAAFSAGVPVIPMAYSRKFSGLFEKTLCYPYVADLKKCSKEEILHIVKATYEKRNELKNIIEEKNISIVEPRIELLEKELSSFFSNL